ncbi:MAG: DUF2271 domain-containing protein [Treponema sp.]|jgi:hypothetical protein|nr:DUF2271 domain-containing protein [Treponema sp.]
MIKSGYFLAPFLALSLSGLAAQSSGNVEIRFSYAKQPGSGSNQFAIWVEDAQGQVIKTIYATRFTAQGGWERRPQSIPQWVKQSGLARMNKAQIDAFTAATPLAGILRYQWDGTDQKRVPVPPGIYQVYVEATLRGENRVVYQAQVEIGGGPVEIQAQARYFGTGEAERNMIGPVTVQYKPRINA